MRDPTVQPQKSSLPPKVFFTKKVKSLLSYKLFTFWKKKGLVEIASRAQQTMRVAAEEDDAKSSSPDVFDSLTDEESEDEVDALTDDVMVARKAQALAPYLPAPPPSSATRGRRAARRPPICGCPPYL